MLLCRPPANCTCIIMGIVYSLLLHWVLLHSHYNCQLLWSSFQDTVFCVGCQILFLAKTLLCSSSSGQRLHTYTDRDWLGKSHTCYLNLHPQPTKYTWHGRKLVPMTAGSYILRFIHIYLWEALKGSVLVRVVLVWLPKASYSLTTIALVELTNSTCWGKCKIYGSYEITIHSLFSLSPGLLLDCQWWKMTLDHLSLHWVHKEISLWPYVYTSPHPISLENLIFCLSRCKLSPFPLISLQPFIFSPSLSKLSFFPLSCLKISYSPLSRFFFAYVTPVPRQYIALASPLASTS